MIYLAAVLVVSCAGGVAAARDAESGQDPKNDFHVPGGRAHLPHNWGPSKQELAGINGRMQRFLEARDQPSAREARKVSRYAYRHLGFADAALAARQKHGDILSDPGWRPFRPRAGQRILRYTRPDEAVIATPGKGKTRVESILPLRAKAPSGAHVPVNVSLDDHGAFFAPHAPLTALRLSKRLGDGSSLGDIGVTVVPDGLRTSEAKLVDGKPFWANVATDTDYLVRALPTGIESLWQLRSQASPQDVRLRLHLPDGAVLRLVRYPPAPKGSPMGSAGLAAAEIVKGESVLATIAAPRTADADGLPVATSMRVDGDSLVISVDHRGKDIAYPLLVDPPIAVTDKFWANGADACAAGNGDPNCYGHDFDGWSWGGANPVTESWDPWIGTISYIGFPNYPAHPGLCHDDTSAYCNGGWGRGLYTFPRDYTSVWNGDFAQWVFWAGNTVSGVNIDDAQFYDTFSWNYNPYYQFSARHGLANWNGAVSTWDSYRFPYQGFYHEFCNPHDQSYSCGPATNGQDAIAAYERVYAAVDGSTFAGVGLYLASGYVVMNDYAGPNNIAASHSNPLSGWVDNATESVTASASDGGVGVQNLQVVRGDGTAIAGNSYGCQGDRHQWCPYNWSTALSYSTTDVPDGIQTLQVRATDAWGNQSTGAPWQVKVDNHPPSAQPSGDLYDARNVPDEAGGTDYGYVTGDEPLSVSATDAGSGVASLEVDVDGALAHGGGLYTTQCGTDACPSNASHDYVIHTGELSAGDHEIKVIARDKLASPTSTSPDNHTSVHAFTVHVSESPSASNNTESDSSVAPPNGSASGSTEDPSPLGRDLTLAERTQAELVVQADAANPTTALAKVLGGSGYTVTAIGPLTDGTDPVSGQLNTVGATMELTLGAPHAVDQVVPSYRPPWPGTTAYVPYLAHFVAARAGDLLVDVDLQTGIGQIIDIEPGTNSQDSVFEPVPGQGTLPPLPQDPEQTNN